MRLSRQCDNSLQPIMQLPDFIKRMLAFADKAETNLTAAAELSKAQEKVSELQGQITLQVGKITALEASSAEQLGLLQKANADIKVKDAKIVELQAAVTKADNKANETIAAQGLPVDQVPNAEAGKAGGAAPKTLLEQYNALAAVDARKAGQFYMDNRDKM
jgi:hypothetical protein